MSPDSATAFARAWRPNPVEADYAVEAVEGEIPRELRGTLYRNGPCQKVLPRAGAGALHLFDGDALVHAIRFEDGGASCRSRFAQTPSFLREQEEGVYCLGGINVRSERELEDPPPNVQPNTNIVPHAGRLLALVENAPPFEMDADSLDSKGTWDLDGRLLGRSTAAHPRIDGRTGEMWVHGYQPVEPTLQLYRIEPDGRVALAEAFEAPWPSMMHDMALTESHVILPLGSLYFDLDALVARRPFHEVLAPRPGLNLKFGIRSREPGSPVRWFDAPSEGFMFHAGNAWERDGRITLDACKYEDPAALMEMLETLRRGEIRGDCFAHPYLYEFDLEAGTCTETKLSDMSAEFPRLDDRRVGHPSRWLYAATAEPAAGADGLFRRITKFDRRGGPAASRAAAAGQWVGEPIFVPRYPGAEEDEGFVLFQLYDAASDRTAIEILDARAVEAEPLARLWMRERIPLGFHGNWLATAA